MEYITFFHNSDKYIEVFEPKADKRPTFYWFNDRYHNHSGVSFRNKYFYLFVKNPKRNDIEFRNRGAGLDFNGLYQSYFNYLRERDGLYSKGNSNQYVQPPILMSFSIILPNIIAEYDESTDLYQIIKPVLSQEIKFRLYREEGYPKNFLEIDELVNTASNIVDSFPFVKPDSNNGIFIYKDWKSMITERMGVWL